MREYVRSQSVYQPSSAPKSEENQKVFERAYKKTMAGKIGKNGMDKDKKCIIF
jgi:hypothetical protein